MGSPYLLAHGLGRPVADATTTVELPAAGKYRVFVRTKDWVARWNAPGQPGKFQVLIDGQPLAETFGTKGADWFWQDGGTVEITDRQAASGPARPDRLRRPLRRDPVDARTGLHAAERLRRARPTGGGSCWACPRSRRRRRATIWWWWAAAMPGWARRSPRPAWAARWP